MKALTIAYLNLQRMFRVRSNIFFVIVMPMMLILLIGAMFGSGSKPKLGILDLSNGALSVDLLERINTDDDFVFEAHDDEDSLVDAVSDGSISAGLVVPSQYDSSLESGNPASVRFIARPDTGASQLQASVRSAVAGQAESIRARLLVQDELDLPSPDATALVKTATDSAARVGVATREAGEAFFSEGLDQFDLGSSSQLLLFIFITSLTGSAALVETRQFGVSLRMLSTPTPISTILLGESLGRFAVAITQGLIVMLGSALLFGVDWGNPGAAAAVMVSFSLVGAGAGMLVGAIARNDQQAASVGLGLGLGMAAIGGSMVPLEIFPKTMRDIAHITPHAWGNDAFADLLQRNGSFADVITEIGVLFGYAVVLLVVATYALRRTLVR